MTKYFTNIFSVINLYKKASLKSEVVTQMIYGDSFSLVKKGNKWLKIRTKEDNYSGFVQNKKFVPYLKPTHKVHKLFVKVHNFPNKQKKISLLTFGSKIKVLDQKLDFVKFEKGWIKKKDLKLINFKEKSPFKKIKIFKKIKYKWGGKSYKGIDCSGLIQIFLNFNNKYCPRDAKDQVKYFKRNVSLKNIQKDDIIFWKGHVAVALSKNKLIHAYGPMKKTVIMGIDQTIKRIERTAKLKVIGIKRL
tara:strand:- start:391 stop:1131 length:741 start_codon:yes stop_codon:yes gene_type:complete